MSASPVHGRARVDEPEARWHAGRCELARKKETFRGYRGTRNIRIICSMIYYAVESKA